MCLDLKQSLIQKIFLVAKVHWFINCKPFQYYLIQIFPIWLLTLKAKYQFKDQLSPCILIYFPHTYYPVTCGN